MILSKEKHVVLAKDYVVSILQDSADRPDSGKVSSPEQLIEQVVVIPRTDIVHFHYQIKHY
jgi:hypothetical protein